MPLEVFRVDEALPTQLTQVVAFGVDATLVMPRDYVNVIHLSGRLSWPVAYALLVRLSKLASHMQHMCSLTVDMVCRFDRLPDVVEDSALLPLRVIGTGLLGGARPPGVDDHGGASACVGGVYVARCLCLAACRVAGGGMT